MSTFLPFIFLLLPTHLNRQFMNMGGVMSNRELITTSELDDDDMDIGVTVFLPLFDL